MNGPELHLTLNHLPVLLPPLGLILVAAGMYFSSLDLRKAGLCFFIAGGLLAIPTYLSGEPAEVIVKNYPGVSRRAITEHQDAAFISLIAVEITAVAALITFILLLKKKFVPRSVWSLLLVAGVITFALFVKTAHFGGHIRHEEIQTPEERERFDAGMTSLSRPVENERYA